MTFAATRSSIAAALTAVDPITGYAFRPVTFKAGDGWALLSSVVRGPGQSYSPAWRVIVVLGADERTAVLNFENWLGSILDALQPVVYVDQAAPVTLATQAGDVFALQIDARSE